MIAMTSKTHATWICLKKLVNVYLWKQPSGISKRQKYTLDGRKKIKLLETQSSFGMA